eukprot:jgi/Astpho2/5631/Aster-x0692
MPENPTKLFTQAPGVHPDLDAPRPIADAPDPAAQRGHAGPFLQFLEFDASKRLWRGSVLFMSDRRRTTDQPMLHIITASEGQRNGSPRLLAELQGWLYWRFNIEVQVQDVEQAVQYSVECNNDQQWYTFFVAGLAQTWHWAFHSCSGLSADGDHKKWGGGYEFALWRDVLAQHAKHPLHLVVGGGDQVYNDEVFTYSESLRHWLTLGKEGMSAAKWTGTMEQEVQTFYLTHYRQHWCRKHFSDAQQVIPTDIFDGWGSYVHALQTCDVFQGIYRCARTAYMVFQQHTTPETAAADNGIWGLPDPLNPQALATYSWIRLAGQTVAMVAPDQRAGTACIPLQERTKKQIISRESYDALFRRLGALPPTVRHVVLVLTVPLVFPELPAQEAVWRALDNAGVKAAMQKTGLGDKVSDAFHEPKLLDDILDHWTAGQHRHEAKYFVARLQARTLPTLMHTLALDKNVRVTFLGGDVHAGAVGRLYTQPKLQRLRYDHRMMVQFTSSAIVNAPPPPVFIKLLHRFDKAGSFDKPHTRKKQLKIFKRNHPERPKVINLRNWLEVFEEPATDQHVQQLANSEAPITVVPLYVQGPLKQRSKSVIQSCGCAHPTTELTDEL